MDKSFADYLQWFWFSEVGPHRAGAVRPVTCLKKKIELLSGTSPIYPINMLPYFRRLSYEFM